MGAVWHIEEGIAEERALLIDNEQVIAARLSWPGRLAAGQVEDARLISRAGGSPRGVAEFASGEQALVSRLPKEASEGANIRLEITRPSLSEKGRTKMAQARPTDKAPYPAPRLAAQLASEGETPQITRALPIGAWEEVWLNAWASEEIFPLGKISLYEAPAMSLIDIDGEGDPYALSLAVVPAIARMIRTFDLAGNIGIDFPTISEKSKRKAVDDALAAALEGWPHERTAMNGFGFVQIAARLTRIPLSRALAQNRAGAAARFLLRKGERVTGAGALLLTCHPHVKEAVHADWLSELARRTGRVIRWKTDASLAFEAGFAQATPL